MEPTQPPRIFQVPLEGGSGRVPTGAMQFEDDWPGLFLRGDDAIVVAFAIRRLEEALVSSEDPVIGSALSKLTPVADIIDRDVRVR